MCFSLKWFAVLLCFMYFVSETSGQENYLTCGRRKIKSEYLIHNGIGAKAGHWPWHAAIFHRIGGKNKYECGGSILDENTILTASHCVHTTSGVISKSRVVVDVGRIHLKEGNEYTQTHLVKEIIVHPGFSKNSIINDIALIKLSSNITMTKYVQPVCLWTMDSNQELIVGRNGTVVGFGLNEQDVVSDQLKQALIGVVDPLTCIASDRAVFGTHLTPEIFCGKGQTGVSACNGDSGGGMFFEVGGKWFVRGLVSFIPLRGNTELCDPLKPTAYTDVAKYLEWIKQYIDQRVLSFESDVYDIDYEEKLRLFNFGTCGVKLSKVDNYTTSWPLPWVGFVTAPNEDTYRCVVTLISEWYAVGPAHCFQNDGVEIFVLLGYALETLEAECFVKKGYETICHLPSQKRRIQSVIVHPKFDMNNYANNIALIELRSPADTTQPNVKPICMPVTSELRTNSKNNLHEPSLSHVRISLKNIPVRYVESAECTKQYFEQNIVLPLGNTHFCVEIANEEDKRNCHSMKEGTPLQEMKIFNGTERYFLRGFKLIGNSCGSFSKATVFNNMEEYLDWILYNMRYNMLEPSEALRIASINTTQQDTTLETEWSMLQQQPGKEQLRLFNMDTCGLTSTLNQNLGQLTAMPWIGFFEVSENVTGELTSTRSLVVLISEWYAIAPKSSIQNGVVWRHIILGKYNPEAVCLPHSCVRTHQEVDIKTVIMPPSDPPSSVFVLIELLEPADLRIPYIRPICLPLMDPLLQNKPTEVILSSTNSYAFLSKKLTMVNEMICQQRLMYEGFYITSFMNISCGIEAAQFKQTQMIPKLGSPLQMAVWFGGQTRYFLHGMFYDQRQISPPLIYGPYLFYTVGYSDIKWIVENMQEKVLQTSFLTTTKNERVTLRPVQHASKRTLFNFDTCGISTSSYPMPWMGYVLPNAAFNNESSCSVTLISDRYVVGPADCFDDSREVYVVQFGSEGLEMECSEIYISESCTSLFQRIATQKIFLHPQYNRSNYQNGIALVRLAHPVDTSLPYVKPICLPIIDTIRSYDTSSLVMVGHSSFSDSMYRVILVDDKYLDPAECQKRWQGLKVSFNIDWSNHCVITKRSTEEECVDVFAGATLHSLQKHASSYRHFLRGILVHSQRACSIYYPAVYTNTDAHLEWILETMAQPASLPFDLQKELIFRSK
uniref:Peptidase S1 domain-containing protein n=1 Tax=Anopheles christyi TaxID=43041 RepID=A0A182JNZ4_9DIPT